MSLSVTSVVCSPPRIKEVCKLIHALTFFVALNKGKILKSKFKKWEGKKKSDLCNYLKKNSTGTRHQCMPSTIQGQRKKYRFTEIFSSPQK